MITPKNIQIIGNTLAIQWVNGEESFYEAFLLRKNSPSAQNIGEKDIFGNQYGGNTKCDFSGVTLVSFSYVANYAIRLVFSDGHNTGLYPWDYLYNLKNA